MPWHLQPTRLTARHYAQGKSYEARDPFAGVAQVDLWASGLAFIHAARLDVTACEFRQLARQLQGTWQVNKIVYERGFEIVEWDPKRAK